MSSTKKLKAGLKIGMNPIVRNRVTYLLLKQLSKLSYHFQHEESGKQEVSEIIEGENEGAAVQLEDEDTPNPSNFCDEVVVVHTERETNPRVLSPAGNSLQNSESQKV